MKSLSLFLALLGLFTTSIVAYGPYEVQKFEYYVSASPSRVSYSSFTFSDPVSGICTECKYKASRGYGYTAPAALPTKFVACSNKDVKWKYQTEGQIIYVEFGYWQKNNHTHKADWIRILANGTVIPNGCAPFGYYGYKCAPRETRYLTDIVAVV
ncbi:hypothetical protein H072_2392 [Dactylellina haptotyla CBS 200.50]|uniref:Uncharacterized protein n=1 Tax=Dactylellina haptotyla (strain CBS 200.50) TaxID=1284197 RepID=S8C7E5_DACHA|nr:hypothetical protein H072_2392 [Dactylellina haptotyla CBS 200.50]